MPTDNDRPNGARSRAARVCVDSYDQGVFAGRFYCPGSAHEFVFQSMSQFLTQMEDLLDQMHFPQAFTVLRNFSGRGGKSRELEEGEAAKHTGKQATFVVRILFRQNASWQGSLLWEDEDREENFRSVLELILLMDSALKQEKA